MRVVALEEHFTIPDLTRRIDPAAVLARGFPPPDVPWNQNRLAGELAEFGAKRLAAMDQGGITVQVLSAVGPGADLV